MDAEQFKRRTRAFAVSVYQVVATLRSSLANDLMGRQLLRAATSVAANYRAACRAKSRADFVSKLKICEEECDESLYWLEFPLDAGALKPESTGSLLREGNEILSLLVASIKTARSRIP